MDPSYIFCSIIGYFTLLMIVAWYTTRNSSNDAYFLGNKQSPWYAVAFGMIADSLSGVTFISLPGTITTGKFGYMQIVIGYLLGYFIIARVLLPLYYRLNITSIYSYLKGRFGPSSQKTGSFYFLISRIIGASLRLYLAAGVFQYFLFDQYHIPFPLTVAAIIALMLIYTYQGGIKTLVWTDTIQSAFLLLGVVLSITAIMNQLNFGVVDTVVAIKESDYSQVFSWDIGKSSFFGWQFLTGAGIAVVMTGLDQNMMQKSLSCPNLKDAQKNIYWFSFVLLIVNLLFVSLGALLYIYAETIGINLPVDKESGKLITDHVFPFLALNNLGLFTAIIFIFGLTAATFSSADSVLTTLTTSFCIDFLNIDESSEYSERRKTNTRHIVHISFAVVLFLTILICDLVPKDSVLDALFTAAAYSYGPLLGLFAFGLFTEMKVKDRLVPFISILSIVICYVLRENSEAWFDYKFRWELLLINGCITFAGLIAISRKNLGALDHEFIKP